MIVLLTGTPGTGKSTVARILSKKLGYNLISLNDWIFKEAGEAVVDYDDFRSTNVVDVDILEGRLRNINDDVIIEGHLSHFLSIGDIVVVLRAHPRVLNERLTGFSDSKRGENMEAEALDVCLIESLERHDSSKVFEVDTTEKQPEEVAEAIQRIMEGRRDGYRPGKIDWSEELRP
ncbi:MAG: adenylate kinase family protein [Candidatus Hydrothermarchaeaceae archaeon]